MDKINWLGVLADALAGAAGRQGPYASMLMQQRQDQREEDQYQRRKTDSFDLWRQQQEYEAAHPKPVNNDTANDYGFISDKLGPDAANQWLRNQGDPIVTVNLPGNRVYSGPRSQLGAALTGGANPDSVPTAEDGYSYTPGPGGRANKANWKAIGGPSPRGSGGFR